MPSLTATASPQTATPMRSTCPGILRTSAGPVQPPTRNPRRQRHHRRPVHVPEHGEGDRGDRVRDRAEHVLHRVHPGQRLGHHGDEQGEHDDAPGRPEVPDVDRHAGHAGQQPRAALVMARPGRPGPGRPVLPGRGEQGQRGGPDQDRGHPHERLRRRDQQQGRARPAAQGGDRPEAAYPAGLPGQLRPGPRRRAHPGEQQRDRVRHVGGQRRQPDREQRRVGDHRRQAHHRADDARDHPGRRQRQPLGNGHAPDPSTRAVARRSRGPRSAAAPSMRCLPAGIGFSL